MSYIRISNDSFFDKEYYSTFAKQDEYKFFNVGSSFSTLVTFYKDLLREVLNNKVDEVFRDEVIESNQIKQIKEVFERE
ncbi:hypothetical protein SAMN04489761_2819 [Tenacibaculum sp. MAR_2009_124]|uniref:hypothetical protein n=1 Tax=Tenacibaculum sp. MAR_2009_124 TaxID=1250059 RepID=UPI000894BBA0|nr:hypothetical protein [Tenacibaculum sp. MAR_2009_124]SEC37587.1 hypothetical protein SAMN04489761_2819 [Tenacibaculum sp. MAR_2009_124]